MESVEYTVVREALIEVEGRQTKVDGNGIGDGDQRYGLYTCDTSFIIHYSSSLFTKESVSTNNHRGGNYGSCGGTIAIVDSDGTIIQVINEVEAAMGAESDDDY